MIKNITWIDIVNALHQNFSLIRNESGKVAFYLDGRGINIFHGEPTARQEEVLIYTLFDTYRESKKRGIVEINYQGLHRLCFRTQKSTKAEEILAHYVDAVPNIINQDPSLNGLIEDGMIHFGEGKGGWINLGGTLSRCLDFISHTTIRKMRK